jgi:acetolactate synthase I/II/III large subunit
LIESATRPLAVVAGSAWDPDRVERFREWAEGWRIPVVTGFRRQDLFDNLSPLYVGTIGLAVHPQVTEALAESDLVLVVANHVDGMTRRALGRAGRVEQATLETLPDGRGDKLWGDWHDRYEERVASGEWATFVRAVQERLPEAIVTSGAGLFSRLPQQHWVFRRFPSQLAPPAGSMGYGLPAAIAAKLAFPERPAVCFTGDGDFLMNGQELATAAQYGAPLLVLLVNNGEYGTIRAHQERMHPGEPPYGIELRNPDFGLLARAYGAHAERVLWPGEFEAALDACVAALDEGGSALLELVVNSPASASG